MLLKKETVLYLLANLAFEWQFLFIVNFLDMNCQVFDHL